MAKCRSDNTEKKQRNLIPYKPGQSGNPKGRPRGSRNKLSEQFIADLHESWLALGKAVITTVAWTDPVAYLRVIASLVPKDIEATVTDDHLERMTTPELEARLRALEAEDGAEILRTRRCGF